MKTIRPKKTKMLENANQLAEILTNSKALSI